MFRQLIPLALIALSAAPAPPIAGRQAVLRELNALDIRVANMADRIAVRGVSLCPKPVRRLAVVLEDAALYSGEERSAAIQLFGLGESPAFTYPATLAGYSVTAIGDRPIGAAIRKRPRARIDAIEQAIEAGAVLTIQKDGVTRRLGSSPNSGCPSRVQVLPSNKKDAKADGDVVQINSGIIAETQDDDELAFIIAHEMAHNILHHPAHLNKVGRTAKTIYPTEVEADRLGLKLMRAGGFDPLAAARFWARFGEKTDAGIFSDGTHMRAGMRAIFLRDEAQKIAQ
jgi:beta-barrel assembly-enhancing protease